MSSDKQRGNSVGHSGDIQKLIEDEDFPGVEMQNFPRSNTHTEHKQTVSPEVMQGYQSDEEMLREEHKKLPRKHWYNCFSQDMNVQRMVSLSGTTQPRNRISNAVNNQKYSLINFLPIVLFNQFKLFFNFFQLAINLSQFVPILKVGFLFTYIAPLIMVLLFTILKQAYDDFKRFRRDQEANSAIYKYSQDKCRIIKNDALIDVKSAKIRVGDIVVINAKERIPADIVILSTSEPSGSIFIKTDQLDGETDWKIRRAVRSTHHVLSGNMFANIQDAYINYAPACDDIYEFIGSMTWRDKKQSLNLDNTAWANTVLAAGQLIGVVIFTGTETRVNMNSRQPNTKVGRFDNQVNKISKILFVIMLVLALVMNMFHQFNRLWPIYYFRYVLLLASIIPISLRVNLDFSKTFFSSKISNDPNIPGTVSRNSSIPEELGRIQYLLSDKTGTLTYNDMIFKKLCVNEVLYTIEEIEELKKMILKAGQKFPGPMGDVSQIVPGESDKKKVRRRQECIVKDMGTALVICNNVTPIEDNGARVLQASSPDEIALVKFSQSLGFLLQERDKTFIHIRTPNNTIEKYEILANFPFSSQTKRMGIVIRSTETKRIFFYLKGADMVMVKLAKPLYRGYIQDECDNLAREGLRTLVITQKQLSDEQFNKWNQKYEQASCMMKNRHASMIKVMEKLEEEMDLIGITGVEDRLQDDVAVTIEALRMAGIKVWMLTGDKVETAKCIAISAGLKSTNQSIFEIRGDDQTILQDKLLQFSNKSTDNVLLIDGPSLTIILATHSALFFDIASKAPSVICCRCLPTQKAMITDRIKNISGKTVAGIGDGGNDVGMIQTSSVGIGIVGKEGNHAALASDFSILEFKYVKNLILWHGRNSYKRAAALSQFVIHRGLIISILQMAFSIIFYNVAIPIYNGMLMLGYATLYTSLPVFSIIFDEDVTLQKCMLYPNLYITLRKSRDLNIKTFFIWLWISIYQGVIIMVLSLVLFEQSFVRIVTITFTSLIISEILNVATTIHRLNKWIIGSQILTLMIYALSLIFLKNYIDTSKIDTDFLWKVLAIVGVSWTPIHLGKCIIRRISPTEEDRITN